MFLRSSRAYDENADYSNGVSRSGDPVGETRHADAALIGLFDLWNSGRYLLLVSPDNVCNETDSVTGVDWRWRGV